MKIELSDKVIATVKIPVEITENDIGDLMVTIIEGGSNYWLNPTRMDCPKGEAISLWAAQRLIDGKDYHFIHDNEENTTEILTLEKLLKGIELNFQKRPWDNDKQNWDATSADCIVQLALFGEIVYG
jgi:hypothetical protein